MRTEELKGFHAVEGNPDVRGWEVISREGRHFGEVVDLLADDEDRQARYLEVRTDDPLEEVTVSGARRSEIPARTVGESLVRDSLLDIENKMTAGYHPGESPHHVLIPLGQAHLESDKHQVRVE